MIKDHLAVMDSLKEYASPKARLTRMLKSGKLIQIRRGLFIDEPSVPGKCLAAVIYGPSYLSFDYALSVNGLIPERVPVYTSATFRKNKNKSYGTPLGVFTYQYLPSAVYPYGICRKEESGLPYLIAQPEKALCDMVYKVPGISSLKDITQFLLTDMRIEKGDLLSMDSEFITGIAPLYRSKSVQLLSAWYRKELKNA